MFDLIECNIKDIKKAFKNNELTSKDLVLDYLKRIAFIDQGVIKYNSVLEVNPDALYEAEIRDYERENNTDFGFLHGIPVLLKDNINTSGKMHTTAGTYALKDHFADDAFIVKRLREEGAIILGKTNLTELANFMTQNMRNGYSSLGGEVLCPYNLEKDPSGSSSGSAVSVSINLAPISIGTETGGSIMSPAMQNGVVGIKPTMGLVSREGIIPISSTLDTAGPMAKNVYDAALLLSAIRGNDEQDAITLRKSNVRVDYTKVLDNINPKSMRVGIDFNNFDSLSIKRKNTFLETVELLKKEGVTIVDNLELKQSTKIYHVMLYEFKRVFNTYLNKYPSKIKTLNDLIDFNKSHKDICLKYGQTVITEANNQSGRLNEIEYIEALDERNKLSNMLFDSFKEHKLDAIYFANYTSLGPHCGFPTMTVPIGIDEVNIPIGCYLLSNRLSEDKLIRVGALIEELVKGRMNPIND